MKKNTLLISVIFLATSFFNVNGQETFEKYYDLNLGVLSWNDGGQRVEQALNGDYMILSSIGFIGWGDDLITYAFVKTDIFGGPLFTKISTDDRQLFDFCFTEDQSILAVGKVDPGLMTPSPSVLRKLNSDCEVVWTQIYEGIQGIKSIIKSMDGQFVMAGDLGYDYHMSKCNENGDSIWTRQYLPQEYFYPLGAIECNDSSLVLHGDSDGGTAIIKTNKNGEQIWNNAIADVSNALICVSYDGGFIAAGNINGEIGVVKLDSDGNQVWNETYNLSGDVHSICQGLDDEYLITSSPNYLFKIDGSGSLIWMQNYGTQLYDAKLTNDNLIVATGRYFDGSTNFTYLVKTTQDGLITSIQNNIDFKKQELQIYPNPTTGIIKMNLELYAEENVSLFIYDLNGQELKNIPLGITNAEEIELNLDDLLPGVYFCKIQVGDKIMTQKIIKQ